MLCSNAILKENKESKETNLSVYIFLFKGFLTPFWMKSKNHQSNENTSLRIMFVFTSGLSSYFSLWRKKLSASNLVSGLLNPDEAEKKKDYVICAITALGAVGRNRLYVRHFWAIRDGSLTWSRFHWDGEMGMDDDVFKEGRVFTMDG